MHVPRPQGVEDREVTSKPPVKALHCGAVGAWPMSDELRPPVVAPIDHGGNAKRRLEARAIDPREQLSEICVDRLTARLVDQREAAGESEDGHRSPTAMGIARCLD